MSSRSFRASVFAMIAVQMLGLPLAAKDGKIGAYTKKSGGVTVKRAANGTIEVMDEETVYTPHSSPGFRSGKKSGGKVGAYVKKSAGSTVKRNADGTVEVTDTSSTTKRPATTSAKSAKSSSKK